MSRIDQNFGKVAVLTGGASAEREVSLMSGKGVLEAETARAARSALRGQGLVPLQVDGQVVASIIAAWTGIPLGKMVKDEIDTVRQLSKRHRLLNPPMLAEGARRFGQATWTKTAQRND